MKIISDFHLHSKFSQATSQDMDVPTISQWAKLKGVNLVGSADFTHPLWLQELKKYLKPAGNYHYQYDGVNYFLVTEVSNMYQKNAKVRKIHNLIFAPDFNAVEKINIVLSRYGNLLIEGRPTLALDCAELVKLMMDISDKCIVVPSHVWEQQFSLFGSNAGFSSLIECFGSQIRYINSIETGISSDPSMNWRHSQLDTMTLLSNSDAHAPTEIGREANVFEVNDMDDLYTEFLEMLIAKDNSKFLYTIETYPEEGRHFYNGHKECGVKIQPVKTTEIINPCPSCKKQIAYGVMHRVEELADREEGFEPRESIPYKKVMPLEEIISNVTEKGRNSAQIKKEYFRLVYKYGSEINLLTELTESELNTISDQRIAEAIIRMRHGDVSIAQGYDGLYGSVKINLPVAQADSLADQQLSLL
ncbi:MAG: hypothetical protein A2252_02685 [Elusimicrobia bacterium RIFOXYA2_FULL_39_19]|nr:MAG: hypothetical protein A2252_02685 [Elusimicrobia bacterium RIFOXYA2_FULL_39_19]